MSLLTSIENAGPDRRARRLRFEDGGEAVVTAAAVVRVLGLAVGDDVDREELSHEIERVSPDCARERALRILGFRDRTTTELTKRLIDDGYASRVAHEVVDRYIELELLDDARFAKRWVEARTTSGYGPSRIERELREKGICPEAAHAAVAGGDPDAVIERARSLVARVDMADPAARRRAFGKLVRKGFPPAVVARVLSSGEHGDE